MENLVGKSHSISMKVEEQHTASYVGSGDMMVFATPIMIALMENAAMSLLSLALSIEDSSVGTAVDCKHTRATAVGAVVTATATVDKVDGRAVEFTIVATDEKGEIGTARHTRFVVNRERFLGKLG
ncbi:MAG: thioesterase family protein [Rikenellaceae bacterium]